MSTIFQTEPFTVEQGVKPQHRAQAAQGYWRAFSRKLRYPLGPEKKAVAFLERVMDPSHAMSAVSKDGAFLGMAGFKSPQGALVGGDMRDMARVYGWIGGSVRGALLHVLERTCDGDTLLMDGIFVEPEARGQGVGTALLNAIEVYCARQGLRQIRLDVIDTNPRARALYERLGFAERSVLSLGPLRSVFGFSSATEMTKAIVR
ncbi:GNAT family N-acetyltransferase [Celeribacter sp. HF31]|uniref:GNAT family N-acetyltransferase n=1 Tax=Celeribacter sp. HF31 TaxID=2721558 RepID=UPI0014315A0C|nr:GNAT family N-acetyltransferase [Celeribacter sp. HF31]NIY78780.1 GNAT family N-acetyltransferase [Celeribacter sp. HF31]